MEKQLMIQIDHVSKEYRLGAIGGTTLREDLARLGAKIWKKEDPTLKIGQSNKHYGEKFLALDNVSFNVYQGEAVGIIGHNGAGKSTLLKLISRVTAPTKGQIGLNGRVASMLEVGTGFHLELTGRENIYMNGAILGMKRTEIDSKIDQIIDFSECREFIDTPVKRYSSGMYVKLAFSVAAHLDNEIMIMDEILAVGDMAFQQKCLRKMLDASNQEGKTILYVSHNMNTIKQLCDRCVVLERGKVIFDGNVEDAIALYMGSHDDESVSIDLSEHPRELWVPRHSVHTTHAEFIGKTNSSFDENEILLNIQWKNLEKVDNLCLRIEIWSMDNATQGSYMLYNFYSGQEGEYGDVNVKLDISAFKEASYRMVYVFFYNDEYGNNMDLDIIYGLVFKKTNLSDDQKVIWRPKNWGYIELPTPEIIV